MPSLTSERQIMRVIRLNLHMSMPMRSSIGKGVIGMDNWMAMGHHVKCSSFKTANCTKVLIIASPIYMVT